MIGMTAGALLREKILAADLGPNTTLTVRRAELERIDVLAKQLGWSKRKVVVTAIEVMEATLREEVSHVPSLVTFFEAERTRTRVIDG